MRSRLTIDLGAITSNYRLLSDKAQPSICSAVIKANAYGLGAEPIARRLWVEGCGHFFFNDLQEAKEIEASWIGEPNRPAFYVLGGLAGASPEEFDEAIPVLNHSDDIEKWLDHCRRNGARPAILHLDTGLSRLGLPNEDWRYWQKRRDDLAVGSWPFFMSHLACADDPEHPMNHRQLELFTSALGWWQDNVSAKTRGTLSASSGIFLGDIYHFGLVRPGAALYGIAPNVNANQLAPVVTLEAPILQLRRIDAGETVGYGADYRSPSGGLLATLGIGYADGVFRAFGNRGKVVIGGCDAPIVGRISMDLMTVDITRLADGLCKVGDYALLIGKGQECDQWALQGGTIGYEILTSMGHRLEKIYRDNGVGQK